MIRNLLAAATLLLALTPTARAHRLDEYLQATILSVDRNQLHASMRLIPGIAIAPAVLAVIDTDHDGLFSPAEQKAYTTLVLAGLTFTADGQILKPSILTATFPQPNQLRDGLGEIHLELTATLPTPRSPHRTLTLANHYRNTGSAYLVNALVPTDPAIEITAQTRNDQQSVYRLDYTQSTPVSGSNQRTSILAATLALIALASWLIHRVRSLDPPLAKRQHAYQQTSIVTDRQIESRFERADFSPAAKSKA